MAVKKITITTIICNRCGLAVDGKVYDHRDWIKFKVEYVDTVYSYDLCGDCRIALKKWLGE